MVRAKGARSQQWYSENRMLWVRKKARTSLLFNLHLAGDFHPSVEAARHSSRAHMMRVMCVQNIAPENGFANGSQGANRSKNVDVRCAPNILLSLSLSRYSPPRSPDELVPSSDREQAPRSSCVRP